MAQKPQTPTTEPKRGRGRPKKNAPVQIEVKKTRGYTKKVAVKTAPKRPLGQPAVEVDYKSKYDRLEREHKKLIKEAKDEHHARQIAEQSVEDYRELVKKASKTFFGRRAIRNAKARMPWGLF